MTREELIEICASDNSSFCHNICRTEEGFSCEVCAENQLEEYEKQIKSAVIDDCIEYFSLHAKEIYEHVSARDFICDRLEQLKGE